LLLIIATEITTNLFKMANKDLFKQAIAEAKSVREAAIANAKEALEESLTPHLKDMLAAKLQEMEDKEVDEVAVNETEEEVEESTEVTAEETVEEDLTAVEEAEDDAEMEADDEGEEAPEEAEDELESEDEPADDEDLKDLSVEDFKDLIRDIISQEMGGAGEGDLEAELPADDMDAGADLEEPGEGDPMAGEEGDEEIDLDELIRELEAVSEGESEDDMEEGKKEEEETMEETAVGAAANEVPAESDSKEKNINDTVKESSELNEALETIETLRKELNEVNLLNSKLLYVNKIFKANNLSESQKVNIIAAFDKAETVKEVKLVFETVSDNVVAKKETTIKEHKGMASKATGVTASKPEVIAEVSDTVRRMQKLAGIIK
jgi:hypothetical protein